MVSAWGRNYGHGAHCRFDRVEPTTGWRVLCYRPSGHSGEHRGRITVDWVRKALGVTGIEYAQFAWDATPRAPLRRLENA